MEISIFGFVASALIALVFTWRKFRHRPSLTLFLLIALLSIHGAPMLVYLFVTGPDTFIFEAALRPVDAQSTKTILLWAMAGMFAMVLFGITFAPLLMPKRWRTAQHKKVEVTYFNIEPRYRANALGRLALWLIALGMLGVIMIEGQPLKIVNYFSAGESEFEKILLRRSDGGTNFYIYNVFLYSLAPFVVMMLYCLQKFNPRDTELKVLFILFLSLVLIGKFGTLSKSPPVIFLLQLGLLKVLLSRGTVDFKSWARLFALAIVLLTFIVKFTIPDIDLFDVYKFLYYRIFDIPNEGLLEFFSAFPHTLRHGWEYGPLGSATRPPGEALVPNYFAVSEITRGIVISSCNVMLVGDGWAEYSWIGMFRSSFMVGWLVRSLDIYAFRNGRTDEWACLNAACVFGIFTMLSTAFSTSLITGGLLLIPMLSHLFIRKSRAKHRVSLQTTAYRSA